MLPTKPIWIEHQHSAWNKARWLLLETDTTITLLETNDNTGISVINGIHSYYTKRQKTTPEIAHKLWILGNLNTYHTNHEPAEYCLFTPYEPHYSYLRPDQARTITGHDLPNLRGDMNFLKYYENQQ